MSTKSNAFAIRLVVIITLYYCNLYPRARAVVPYRGSLFLHTTHYCNSPSLILYVYLRRKTISVHAAVGTQYYAHHSSRGKYSRTFGWRYNIGDISVRLVTACNEFFFFLKRMSYVDKLWIIYETAWFTAFISFNVWLIIRSAVRFHDREVYNNSVRLAQDENQICESYGGAAWSIAFIIESPDVVDGPRGEAE